MYQLDGLFHLVSCSNLATYRPERQEYIHGLIKHKTVKLPEESSELEVCLNLILF